MPMVAQCATMTKLRGMALLQSNRLILRPLNIEDASEIARLAGEWEVAQWTASIPHPYDQKGAKDWISYVIGQSRECVYAITRDNLLVGVISFDTESGEVGYWIGREYWGSGFATEALVTIADYATSIELPYVLWGACLPSNLASIRVLQKAGFHNNGKSAIFGRLRHNGAILLKFSYSRSTAGTPGGTQQTMGRNMSNSTTQPKVLLMLSGGPDSATLASVVQKETAAGTQIHAIYLRSGHPSDDQEIRSANAILQPIGGKLEIIDITPTITALGSSRLLIHSEASILPFGNVIALGIASSYGLRIGASKIYIALHADDAEENVEYTSDYIDSIGRLFAQATSSAPEIVAPFIGLRKSEVFKKGRELGTNYAATWSCIRGRDIHCGDCGACRSRRRAFVAAGIADPTSYAREPLAIETVGIERTLA